MGYAIYTRLRKKPASAPSSSSIRSKDHGFERDRTIRFRRLEGVGIRPRSCDLGAGRYSEVRDGMEKDPTLLGMLGFVAQGATQPYFPTGGLPTVDSLAAIGRPSLALHLHEFIHRHHIVIEMSHDHHRAKNDQTGHEHPKCQREKVIRLIGRT